ncbi:probable cytochrome b5 [Ramularia collo-cygni]|uniref:Probable cytochrome b5 n=1 Tax=Ramularia collo-cygni TaxID=112498 RepID=A0A2D3VKZ7_9PEZI|nr:probable cytochrome b5 [Ramularia collo-cygni]CZT25301.1 probable cytochrome b5 [Ramularia collo-cygni]
MSKEFTFSDVAEHTSKKDLYMIVHDKVYDVGSFVDEHPGGEEVMLDVGGQDATEAFEDVGHSDEAREILDGLLVGNLKRQEGDPQPKTAAQQVADARKSTASSGGLGVGVYAIVLVGAAAAFFAFQYLQNSEKK